MTILPGGAVIFQLHATLCSKYTNELRILAGRTPIGPSSVILPPQPK